MKTDKLIGVQLGSHSIFDEGPEHCLDILQNEGSINAVFVYSHTYQGFAKGRNPNALAPDHGVEIRDPRERDLTMVWVPPHDEYYAETFLRHRQQSDRFEYADRDVFDEIIGPAHRRGVKLYARILEGFGRQLAERIPNWVNILSVDVYGRLNHLPCWNKPAYRNWWLGTVEDLFKSYPLDGFKWGSERSGPLPNVLMGAWWGEYVPICFCESCRAKGRAQGINVDRARRGFQELYEFIYGLLQGTADATDGVLVTVLRYLLRYPEILAWEYMWHESRESLKREMYGAIKAIDPEAQVGYHVYHQGTTWDPIYRAEMDYSELVNYADWLKPVVYHDIAGPRVKANFVERTKDGILQELSEPMILNLLYAVMGFDPAQEPELDEMDERGFSADYVYRETKRCVQGVNDQIPVYPGLGFDIPWGGDHFPSEPDLVYQTTMKAFEAGASGLVVSREYDEMRLPNLNAVRRAVADADAAGL